MQITVKTAKDTFIQVRKIVGLAAVRGTRPMKRVINRVTIDMLIAWPTNLMVPRVEEAMPYRRIGTDPMIALLLGDAKRAKPSPARRRLVTSR